MLSVKCTPTELMLALASQFGSEKTADKKKPVNCQYAIFQT